VNSRNVVYIMYVGCGRCGVFYGLICCVVGLPCLFSCTYRTKIRSKFGLPESPTSDCVTHFFCECCALCQEHRELKTRGLDPSIGKLHCFVDSLSIEIISVFHTFD